MRKTPFFLFAGILSAVLFSAVFFLPKYKNGGNDSTPRKYAELWHIETFEGGTGSRAAFLNSVSREYLKKKNVLITVKIQTPLSAKKLFDEGIYPDLLSYGNGTELPYGMLRAFGNKKVYADVWCAGGYVAVSRKGKEIDEVIISEQKNTLPRLAIGFNDPKLLSYESIAVSSELAVYEFYKKERAMLIGTQRDLYRLENKGLDLEIKPLGEYCDLFQYLSVLSPSDDAAVTAAGFAAYLLCEDVQARLGKIGMLSATYRISDSGQPVSALADEKHRIVTPPLIKSDELEKLKTLSADFEKNKETVEGMLERVR